SSITMPKRSSTPTDSSMKSSESRPSDPSTPLGSVVLSVISAARRGSKRRRSTTIVLSSSSTSFWVTALLLRGRSCRARARRRQRFGPHEAGALAAPAAGEVECASRAGLAPDVQRGQRLAAQRLAEAAGERAPAASPVPGLEPDLAPAGLEPETGRRLDERRSGQPAAARVDVLALLEGLHG